MLKFNFEAQNTDGSRTKGVLEAESQREALKKVKEKGLLPVAIRPVSADLSNTPSVPPSPPAANEVKRFYSFGWKIRFRKLLAFYIPFLLVAGIGFYLFSAGRPGWLTFGMMVAGLFLFGFAGSRAEQKMLDEFICPQCQTPIEDWDVDATHRIIYDCSKCKVKWDIGYKSRSGC
jgi:hypothetical protein